MSHLQYCVDINIFLIQYRNNVVVPDLPLVLYLVGHKAFIILIPESFTIIQNNAGLLDDGGRVTDSI